MKRSIVLFASVALLACSGGCRTSKLTSANVRRLQLGQTTAAQALAAFGEPSGVAERSGAEGASKVINWEFSPGPQPKYVYRRFDLRYLAADFYNDRVRAWVYLSTARKDPTSIRSSAVPQVVKGQTTREEVLRLLGEPAGRALRGTTLADYAGEFDAGVTEIWQWGAIDGAAGWTPLRMAVRMLLVKFDGSGRVLGVAQRTVKR